MAKVLNWLFISNRQWHLIGVCAISLVLGWASGITAIICLEFKDVQGANSLKAWDWLDVAAGLIGGITGGAVHWVLLKHW